jgi:hypothetical protein
VPSSEHGPGECRLETDQVRAAFVGIDVVGEGVNFLVIPVVVLDGDFDFDALLDTFEENRRRMDGGLGPVDVFNKGGYSPFIMKIVPFFSAFVEDMNAHAGIQEGHLTQSL